MSANMSYKIKVGLDGQEAHAGIENIRKEMEGLSGKTIGVDVSAAEAKAKIKELRVDLEELAVQHPDINVRVEAGKALAELAAIDAAAKELNGKEIRLNVDDGGSADRSKANLNALMMAGLALGPAIIPVAAATAAAVAAIGTGAVAGVAALGVVKLAFSGMGTATQELTTAQQKSGATAAQTAAQQISSANSIASAKDTLATATENVGVAEEQAARSVRLASEQAVTAHIATAAAVNHEQDAEENLGTAQRAVERAQRDLTQAHIDANRALQDMSFSVTDNALAQKRAQLDIEAAQKALLSIAATDPRRAGAELTLAESQQRLLELQTQGQRLGQDKTVADAKGVEGSKQVENATDTLASAQIRLGNAQQAVLDASTAITQAQVHERDAVEAISVAKATGDRQVEAAHQAVTSASRALQNAEASAAAQTAATAAAQASQYEALNKLSPAGQQFAHFLHDDLQPKLRELQATAQAGLLPGIESGLKAAMPVFPEINGLVHDFATGLGDLADRAGHALNDPFWQGFISFVREQAGPNLRVFGTILGNLAEGGAAMLMAFKPVWDQMGQGIQGWSDRFATASKTMSANPQFQQFIAYVKTEGPVVAQTLGQLVMAFVHLGQDLAGWGAGALQVIDWLARMFNWLTVMEPTMTAWGAAIGVSTYELVKLWPMITKVGEAWKFLSELNIAAKIASAGAATTQMAAQMGISAAASASMGTAVASTGTAALGILGPLAAVAAAGVALKLVWDANITTLKDGTDAMMQGGVAAEMMKAKVDDELTGFGKWLFAGTGWVATSKDMTDEMNKQLAAMDPLHRAQALATQAQNDYTLAVQRFGAESPQAIAAHEKLANATSETAKQQDLLKTATESATDAIKRQTGEAMNATEADIRYRDAVDAASKSMAEHGKTLDLNTDAGRRNQQALIDLAKAGQDQIDAMTKNGATTAQLTSKQDELRQTFIRQATQMGLNNQAAQDLANRYLGIPTNINTTFGAFTAPAINAVNDLAGQISHAMASVANEQVLVTFKGDTGNILAQAKARGGPIFGAGTGTSDSIPALLSHGEHVWTAAEVSRAGGHSAVEGLRGLANAGMLPAYADGGSVSLNALGAGMAGVLAANAQYIKDHITISAPPTPGVAGVERWRPVGLQALSVAGQGADNIGRLLMQMGTESGGNERAINRWDVNWQKGTPSVGLMQVIGPTYNRYKHPAFDTGPYEYGVSENGLSNILAAIRYTLGAYGSLSAGWQGHGYANGGIVTGPTMATLGEAGPEVVLPLNRPHQAGLLARQAGIGGATVHVGPVYVSQEVDIDALGHRLAFSATAAGL